MQSHHFDAGNYPGAIYGANPGFDAGNIKLHHTPYPGDAEAGCYSNHGTMALQQMHGYNGRDQPPAYAEKSFFHPGFMSSFNNSNYYKMSNRQMDSNDYTNSRILSRTQDNFLTKPQESLTASPNGYDPHCHHQQLMQQHQVQQIYDDQAQDLNKCIHEASVYGHGVVKTEPLTPQLDYKSMCTLSTPVSSIVPCQLQVDIKSTNNTTDHMSKFEDSHSDEALPCLDNVQEKGHIKEELVKGNDEATGEAKPTMSYIALIAKAILESEQRRLNLGSIYNWIEKHYPFYKSKGQGWRNSVRHNLSLNDCFIKAGRCEDGKGNYWAIHPANIQDFMKGDFRQRRRSRRRGRKKECDINVYHMPNSYLQSSAAPLASGMAFNTAALSSIYSPYTEAERRAYRLDEALLRQSMSNPFVKWYQPGGVSSSTYTGSTPPPAACSSGMYTNTTGTQWTQTYNETTPQPMYSPLNSTFTR